ncbi:MAG TPA: SMP-30/gluconolactonase/LRE family protein [Rhodothermia bacterium]|nr:SMP-30/gluconolactonase/LRE family protein [Rhodothermia bacterium]
MPTHRPAILFLLLVTGCASGTTESSRTAGSSGQPRLPTGVYLDPAGDSFDAGSMPLAMALSPDGRRIVLLLNGWREQGVQVLDRRTGAIVQTIPQASAFLGLVFSPDGNSLYASGGNDDAVYRYRWTNSRAEMADTIALAVKARDKDGTRYPAGIGISPDGRTMYVAENLADSVAVVDLGTGRVKQRFATERYPYGVAVATDGLVYVSAWGGSTVSVFRSTAAGMLEELGRVTVGRHPSAMTLSRDGTRLFIASGSTDRIAVMDTRSRRVIVTLEDPPPAGPHEGSTPNALALSEDGKRLFVAEADNNAVAVFDLSAATSGVNNVPASSADKLAGRIPMGWYPSALVVANDSLFVVNAKGKGTAPNPKGPQPDRPQRVNPSGYTLGQISGTLMMIRAVNATASELSGFSMRVTRANGWNATRPARRYPPIEHVIYVIKENRTYDQILGDLPAGDGDTSLLFFPRPVTPNHHALAERFGVFDRFFVNAEVSADGHNWSTASYATDYVQKTVPSQYSTRGRSYDYEGTNRGDVTDDDVAEPGTGYLWNLAQRAGITFRNYGEFAIPEDTMPRPTPAMRYLGTKPYLREHTSENFPGYNLNIRDQLRADVWIAELGEFEKAGRMPALEIVRLPNDHTAGLRAGSPTPAAYMADNDLALGRMVEALSKTSFWKTTVMFVLEDDAQNGSDHVDSHRSPLLVISPYSQGGVSHSFANTTDVIATIEDILGLGRLSQFDHYSRPLNYVWRYAPDTRPYVALKPAVSLDAKNPRVGIGARESRRLALAKEDQADEELFNRILWRAIKGENRPWPGIKRMSALEYRR